MAGRDGQRGNGDGKDGGSEESAVGRLMTEARQYVSGVVGDAVGSVGSKAASTVKKAVPDDAGPVGRAVASGVEKLEDGGSPLSAALSGGLTGLKEKVGEKLSQKRRSRKKVVNILESVDVGVPVSVAYNQWTQFHEFPHFMKGVESAERAGDDAGAVKVNWKAKVAFSHRTWQSTIVEQVPDERIAWRSEGPKGTVDGAVTFHGYGPNLTRVIVLLEYHPQGLVERTGNLWRAQGRRTRLDLKNFARFVMMQNEASGSWRGEIRDGDLVRSHQQVTKEEKRRSEAGRNTDGVARDDKEAGRGADNNAAGKARPATKSRSASKARSTRKAPARQVRGRGRERQRAGSR